MKVKGYKRNDWYVNERVHESKSFCNDFSWFTGVPVGRFGFLAWYDVGESLLVLLSLKSSAESFSSLLHFGDLWGLFSNLSCLC